jgi:hypothetical protein
LNTDERRGKEIFHKTDKGLFKTQEDFDIAWQKWLGTEDRKKLGNQQPYALALAFALYLKRNPK